MHLQKQSNSSAVFGNSFLIFLVRFFPSLATLVVVIAFSRYISEEAYGDYQNFWIHLFLFSSLGMMGIPAFIITYRPAYVTHLIGTLRAKHYFGLMAGLCVPALLFVYTRHYTSGTGWYIPFLFFILYCLGAIIESLLIVYRRFAFLVGVNGAYMLVFLWLHYAVITGIYSIDDLFYFLLLPLLLKLMLSWQRLSACLRTTDKDIAASYPKGQVRSLWLHMGLYDVIQRIFTWIDKFIISLLFGAGVSAVYFNGTFDIPFLPLMLGAVSAAALMQLSQKENESTEQAIHIANYTAKMLSSVVFPLFFFLFLFRHELFTVLLTSKYAAAVPIFAVTVCVIPLRAYNFTTILQNRHRGDIINKGAVLDLFLACMLMYPLYRLWDLKGIAMSFVLSSYVQGGYYLYHSARLLGVRVSQLLPLKNWLTKLIVFALLFITIRYTFSLLFAPEIMLISSCIITVLVIALTVFSEFRASRRSNG